MTQQQRHSRFFEDTGCNQVAIELKDTVAAALDEVIAIRGDIAVLGAKAGGRRSLRF